MSLDPEVYFTSGLSDVAAIIGADAELVCRLSSEDCEGVWHKDGNEVRCIGGVTGSKAFTFNI